MAVEKVRFTEVWRRRLEIKLREKSPEYSLRQRDFFDDHKDSAHLRIRVRPTHQASYYIQYRPPVSVQDQELIRKGEMKRPGPTTISFGDIRKVSFKDAVTLAENAWKNLADGIDPKRAKSIEKQLEGPTVREAIHKKIEERGRKKENKEGLSDSYISQMMRQIKTLEKHSMADRKLRTITPDEVKQLLIDIPKKIQEEGSKRGTGEETAKKVIGLLNSTYNFAIEYYWTDENPSRPIIEYNPCNPLRAAKKIKQRGSTSRTRRKAIKQDELRKVWHALLELENYIPDRYNKSVINNVVASYYFRFQLLTGLRGGTLSQLTFDQYDWRRRTFYFHESHAEKLKSDNEKFFMPLSDEAAELINLMHKRHGNASNFVFPNATYKKGIDVGCKEQIKIVRKKTDMNFKSHDLRGTFLTIAEGLGMSHGLISQLADHTSKTSDVTSGYLDTEVEGLREYTQAITDLILISAGIKEEQKEPETFELSSNPFNIKEELHKELENLAEAEEKTVRDIYERCLKLGTLAHKFPDMQAKQLLQMIAML